MPKLPTSWKEISLKTYCGFEKIINDKSLDNHGKDVEIISLLSGISRSEILALPLKTLHECLDKIKFLNYLDLIRPLKNSKHLRFCIKGRWFKIKLNASDLTGGQYIDLMTFLKENENPTANIHNVLAVIVAPLKWGLIPIKYDGKDQSERAAFLYENMSMSIAYPILVFFCNLSQHLTAAMQDYLKTETTKKMNQIQTEMMDIMSVTAGL